MSNVKIKRSVLITSLVAVFGVGIFCFGYVLFGNGGTGSAIEPEERIEIAKADPTEPEIVIDIKAEKPDVAVPEIIPEPIVIDITPVVSTDDNVQELQPVATQPPVPAEPPKFKEGTDINDPEVKPVYEETVVSEPAATPKPEGGEVVTKPKDEGGHEGQMFVPGFGWVEYSGPSQTIEAPEIQLNGNKVGQM